MPAPELNFQLSKTQWDFVTCEDQIVMLLGPMGEGKTFCGTVGLIAHAARCGVPIRGALIRDTFQNIKTSTKPDIESYLGSLVQFSDGGKHMVIKSDPPIEMDLFGIDDPASISKLQGPQYAIIWLEEPAPIYERANAGLPREVFNMALARAARQQGTKMRVQITQNPADEDHWTALLAEEPDEYLTTDEGVTVFKRVFRMRRGENKYLNPIARAATMAAFKDDPAKWQRYVEGVEATVQEGKKVTPGYNPDIHYSERILPIHKGEVIQMWDAWMSPCSILAQYRPIDSFGTQQLVFHDVLFAEGIGTKELTEEQVIPLLNTAKYRNRVERFRIIGDPSMASPDQTTARSSPRKYLEDKFKTRFESGPVTWEARREPLNHCFTTLIGDGVPSVYLSRSAVRLHRALRGGWHYKTDNSGNIIGNKPIQTNAPAHAGNAFSYGIALLMPYQVRHDLKQAAEQVRMKRALSYGGQQFRPTTPGERERVTRGTGYMSVR